MQMSTLRMSEEDLYKKHKELCQQLNMDENSIERSWQSYKSISYNYTLNGNMNHWLCCSIFVACRNQLTRTVGDQGPVLEGNCVSLTRLLRICEISIYEFFTKIKQWMEMASTTKSLRTKVEKLEQSFAVSVLLYKKFGPIFEDMFKKVEALENVKKTSKKSRPIPCSPYKLFEFTWCLFVCAKGEFPDNSVDLVTSFHMLLCCCDLVFANAIDDRRNDLVNARFSGLPTGWDSENFDPATVRVHCIIRNLCNSYDGTYVDAVETKNYAWKQVIEVFFAKGILRGKADSFMSIIQPGNFEHNQKSINHAYETYLLSCGEVDERIFLKSKNFGATAAEDETIQSLVHQTPLTGRTYLRAQNFKDQNAPLAIAQDNVSKLRSAFAAFKGEIPVALTELVRRHECEDTVGAIKQRLTDMKKIFDENFPSTDRWTLVEALYFHLLLNIVEGELKIRPNLDVSTILREVTVQKTLIVCCVEIVVYCYNYNRRFPTVLNWYTMHPFNFYRIIEMVVLYHQDCLTRDIIKHLNMIEEQTLESFAWESSSPIWDRIRQYGQKLPLCQVVDRPKMLGDEDLAGITPHNPNFRRADNDKRIDLDFLRSPSQSVKKQLFQDDNRSVENSPRKPVEPPPIAAPQLDEPEEPVPSQSNLLASVKKTNKAGSLGLFFRKFYKLASVRMLALCNGLEITDSELLKKIWTIFENSVVEQTELMKDRHLDQMIMCAIYVIFRVTKYKTSFADIMKCYRLQPQSASHVYRSVLIKTTNESNEKEESEQQQQQQQQQQPSSRRRAPAEPGDLAVAAQRYENELRGDIIMFYNTIYVKKMQDFALKFAETATENNLLLSPLPHNLNQIMSPKKVSEHHKIYIRPLGKNVLKSPGPAHCLTYQFSGSPIKDSPAKDLREINRFTSEPRSTKRTLINEDGPPTNGGTASGGAGGGLFSDQRPRAKIPRKLENLISDRQEQNKE